jgi:S-adenosylmethionine/arginine decarboxylase-like enzyme
VRRVNETPISRPESSHQHLTAEFLGVSGQQLRDVTMLGGLLIAAASAGGLSPMGVPVVRENRATGGVSAMLLFDDGHLVIHSSPTRQTLLFDLVAPASHDFRKALDVFARRLSAREIRSDTRGRG